MKGQGGIPEIASYPVELQSSESKTTAGVQRSSPHRGGSFQEWLSGVRGWLQVDSPVRSPDLVLSNSEEHPIEMKQHCDECRFMERDRTSKGKVYKSYLMFLDFPLGEILSQISIL